MSHLPSSFDAQRFAELSAQALFSKDVASGSLGIEDVRPGFARLRMTVRADMVNGHGMCHGGPVGSSFLSQRRSIRGVNPYYSGPPREPGLSY